MITSTIDHILNSIEHTNFILIFYGGWGRGCDSPNCRTVQSVAGDNLDSLHLSSADQFVAGNLGTPTVQIVAKSCFSVFFHFMFLHLHEIVEGSYFHCSLSVCLSECVSVSEQNPSQMNAPMNAVFAK